MKSASVCEKTPLLSEAGGRSSRAHYNTSLDVQLPGDNHHHHGPTTTTTSSCCNRLLHCLAAVTVEPAIFLHSLSFGVESVFKTNMVVDKACMIQLNYSQEVCDQLDSGDYDQEQDSVQRIAANYSMYSMWIELLPSVFVMVLLGAWSDTRGRRLPLLLPSVGFTLKALGLALNAYFWPLQPYFILLTYIPYGLTGGMTTLYMAAYAYVGEDSGQRARTTRLSMASIMNIISMPVGQGLGALLFSHGGYMAVFGTEFILAVVSLVYIFARLHETTPRRSPQDPEGPVTEPVGFSTRLKNTLLVAVRNRERGVRSQMFGHIACISLTIATDLYGPYIYLYTRKKFQWTYYDYALWSNFNLPISLIATCVMLPLLSYYLKVQDAVLGFISSVSCAFSGILLGTAPSSWVMYFGRVVFSAGGMAIPGSRGTLSKLVGTDELGAVFSLVGTAESFMPVVITPIYTAIYNSTLEVFPGTIFLTGAGFSLIACILYTWLLDRFGHPDVTSPSNVDIPDEEEEEEEEVGYG